MTTRDLQVERISESAGITDCVAPTDRPCVASFVSLLKRTAYACNEVQFNCHEHLGVSTALRSRVAGHDSTTVTVLPPSFLLQKNDAQLLHSSCKASIACGYDCSVLWPCFDSSELHSTFVWERAGGQETI